MTMLLEGPANTISYMILGFAFILSMMAVYAISLAVRLRRARRDVQMLEGIGEKTR
jgi:hypothetical protein